MLVLHVHCNNNCFPIGKPSVVSNPYSVFYEVNDGIGEVFGYAVVKSPGSN